MSSLKPPLIFVPRGHRLPNNNEVMVQAAMATERASRVALKAACEKVRRELADAPDVPGHERETILALLESNERLILEGEAMNGPLTADDIPWGGQ